MSMHGQIHWSELVTSDIPGSKAYFENVAGWTISETDMPEGKYYICMADGAPVAGMMSTEQLDDPAIPPHWMTYIAVDDVDKAVSETGNGSGTVIRPPFDVPGVGRIAIVSDPGGAVVGLMTPAPGE